MTHRRVIRKRNNGRKGGSALVFAYNPDGEIVTVTDPNQQTPIYDKLPGGGVEAGESPMKAAQRELHEETGLMISPSGLEFVCEFDLTTHTLFLFKMKFLSFKDAGLQPIGETGEITRVLRIEELPFVSSFHPKHLHYLRVVDLVPQRKT